MPGHGPPHSPDCPAAGDGKLGLLVAQVLAVRAPGRVTLFGRHASKMGLVQGLQERLLVDDGTASKHAGAFDLVVEATGERLASCCRRCQVVPWHGM